ncbi:MAG: hypothetical protein DRP78_00350 [Candidatus Omnitrophota bacterium]|nr:MAG: hypothetical protein DRP78_00350 [Candidatus Omnitrophota bacterium]
MKPLLTLQNRHFGRHEIISLLLKRVSALEKQYRQNIAIIGNQSLGKTTLILDLLRHCKAKAVIPIYIDVEIKSVVSFVENFIGVLLYQYLSSIEQTVDDSFEFLIEKSRLKLPKTIAEILKIKELLKNKSNYAEVYNLLLSLSQTLCVEAGKPVLLILDEFQNLRRLNIPDPFLELSNKIMLQRNVMYLLVSSAVYSARRILREKLNLLFGNFEIIQIYPFDYSTAKNYILAKLQNLEIDENYINFLIEFTGSYPFYLDVICDDIKHRCLEIGNNRVTKKIFLYSLVETMYKDYGILNQSFNNKYYSLLNNTDNSMLLPMLLLIAKGNQKSVCISSFLNKKTTVVNKCLNMFIEMDIIYKRGVFNYICDPLFAKWLKFVFSRQKNSFNQDNYAAINKFQDNMSQTFKNFVIESKKSIPQRLKELLELFNDDIVELDKKRFMLTHFDKIVITNINNAVLLNAYKGNKCWYCYVLVDFIEEHMVADFVSNIDKKNSLKKILIAFNGISLNAKLKALEAKLWIWDSNTINELFLLFGRPRVIL